MESSAAGPADLGGESAWEEPEHSSAKGVMTQDDLCGAPDASVVLVGEERQPLRNALAHSSSGSGAPNLLFPRAGINRNPAIPPTDPLPACTPGSRAEVVDDGLASVRIPTTDVGVQAGLSAWDRFSRGVQAIARTLETGLQAVPETLETGAQAGVPFVELLDSSCVTDTLHRLSVGTQTPVHWHWDFDLLDHRITPRPVPGRHLPTGLPYSEITRWGVLNIPLRQGTVTETYHGVEAYLGRVWDHITQRENWIAGSRFTP